MSDNIFAELYSKLLGFFRQAEEEENSKDVARNRLRVVLMQDRTNLTPQILERMRGELIQLLTKYLEMDQDALELNLEQEGDQMALMLSIPVIRAKDEEEIEKALAEEEETSEENDDESDEESDEDVDEDLEDNSEETSDENSDEEPEENTEEEPVLEKLFPNKEICGDCRECEFSDDIECEKKQIKKKKKSKKK